MNINYNIFYNYLVLKVLKNYKKYLIYLVTLIYDFTSILDEF